LGFKSLGIIVSGLITGRKQSIETARTLAGKKFNLLNLPFPYSSYPKRTGIGTYGIIRHGIAKAKEHTPRRTMNISLAKKLRLQIDTSDCKFLDIS